MAFILVLSVLCQLMSAVLALRLIGITKKKVAWLLVAAGITLMTLRRIQSLAMLVSGESIKQSDLVFEIVGLIISALLLTGIYLIRPLFASLVHSEEELRALNTKLSALSEEQRLLIAELRDALDNIKTLKGMLPICAACKKIRDDKGYWSQIEAYVSEHSDAEFTHSICPECARKLYPGYCTDTLHDSNK
jgi:hypothetical protein